MRFDKAAYYRLDNLTAIVDVNRLGQRGPTELGWDLDAYARRLEGFGCRAIPIDGHDLGEIEKALTQAAGADRPTVILARTRKGRGFSEIEDREGWHGKPLPAEMAERAIVELGGERRLTVRGPLPEGGSLRARPSGEVTLPRYQLGAKVATRKAFGELGAWTGCGIVSVTADRRPPARTASSASPLRLRDCQLVTAGWDCPVVVAWC